MNGLATTTAHTFWLTNRRLKVPVKQPAFLVILLVQPAIWLFLFGNLFRRVVELPGFGAVPACRGCSTAR
jgi:ABC-2 type transport system permease protein